MMIFGKRERKKVARGDVMKKERRRKEEHEERGGRNQYSNCMYRESEASAAAPLVYLTLHANYYSIIHPSHSLPFSQRVLKTRRRSGSSTGEHAVCVCDLVYDF